VRDVRGLDIGDGAFERRAEGDEHGLDRCVGWRSFRKEDALEDGSLRGGELGPTCVAV
jgi:hypothetical protein